VFYYVQVRSASAGKQWAGLVVVGKGQEATIITLLQNATYGLAALDAEHEDIRQKATAPAWNQDTDSLEALRDFLELLRGADSDTLETLSDQLDTAQNDLDAPAQYKADVSALALETTLTAMKGAGWSTETLKAIYDLIAGLTAERGTDNAALAVVCTETRLAHLNADVSSRAPSSEYDTQMGTGERASAAKLEDAMQKATAPAYNQDSDSQEAIRERVDEVHTEVAGLDGAAMRGTDNGALASVATEVRLSELDAANLPADIDVIKADTPYITDLSLPGTPASGSLGQIVKDNMDAAVTTRAPSGEYDAQMGTGERASASALGIVDGLHDVPAADSTANAQMRDPIGNKTDAAVETVGTTKSIMAYIKGIIDLLLKNATYGLSAIKTAVSDLITRAKGLDDIHDDLAAEIAREAGLTTEDTYAHPSGTTEGTIIELTITKRTIIHSAKLYTKNLTKETTFRAYYKDNDGIYAQTSDGDFVWPSTGPNSVECVVKHDRDVKFTMQSSVAEGASRNVLYSIIREEMNA